MVIEGPTYVVSQPRSKSRVFCKHTSGIKFDERVLPLICALRG